MAGHSAELDFAQSGPEVTHAGAEEVDVMVKVFTFFSSLRKGVLRKLGRAWGRRSSGNKPELIYRNFLFFKICARFWKGHIPKDAKQR